MAQTVTHWFPDGDYIGRLNEAIQAFNAAKKDADAGRQLPLLNGELDPVDVLAGEYTSLREKAKRDAVKKGREYTLSATPRPVWRALRSAHPARTEGPADDISRDKAAGLNADTVEDDLVHATLSLPAKFACSHDMRMPLLACTVENPCGNRGAYDTWADSLSHGEFQTVLLQSWELANVAQFDPKLLPASQTRTSGGNTP